MPTDIRPDDPNATGAGRLQAMVNGPRDAGTPSIAGKPGVQAGRHSFPAPPTPAASVPGRPPDGARKAMAGQTQPQQPGAPAPGTAPTSAAPQSAAAPPATPGSPQPAPGAGSSQTAGVGAPEAPAAPSLDAGGMATQSFVSTAIPKPAAVPPNSTVQTPYGTVSSSKPSGLALDAAGQQKYKESMAALRSKFTVPRVMRGMQGLPQMEIKLGASNYDPFSGRFHGKE